MGPHCVPNLYQGKSRMELSGTNQNAVSFVRRISRTWRNQQVSYHNFSSWLVAMFLPILCECIASWPCGPHVCSWRWGGYCGSENSSFEGLRSLQGSLDSKVIEGKLETSESTVQVLEGRSGRITSIAANSDGGRIYSCSADGTLRIWSTARGTETDELSQGSTVICVSVRCESGMRALRLDDGTLRILDGRTKCVLFEDTRAHEKWLERFMLCYPDNGRPLGRCRASWPCRQFHLAASPVSDDDTRPASSLILCFYWIAFLIAFRCIWNFFMIWFFSIDLILSYLAF